MVKWCHATTNTHTSHIFLHHTISSTSERANFPIKGPWGPHHSPKIARHTPWNDLLSKLSLQMFKVMSYNHTCTHRPYFFDHTNISTSCRGNFPIQGPQGPHHNPPKWPIFLLNLQTLKVISCNHNYQFWTFFAHFWAFHTPGPFILPLNSPRHYCKQSAKNACSYHSWLLPFENLIGKMGHLGGYVWLFGALVGAPRTLDGEITPPRCASASMMKNNGTGVGICGCMTSL